MANDINNKYFINRLVPFLTEYSSHENPSVEFIRSEWNFIFSTEHPFFFDFIPGCDKHLEGIYKQHPLIPKSTLGKCLCGVAIKCHCIIVNIHNKALTWVGTECVNHFNSKYLNSSCTKDIIRLTEHFDRIKEDVSYICKIPKIDNINFITYFLNDLETQLIQNITNKNHFRKIKNNMYKLNIDDYITLDSIVDINLKILDHFKQELPFEEIDMHNLVLNGRNDQLKKSYLDLHPHAKNGRVHAHDLVEVKWKPITPIIECKLCRKNDNYSIKNIQLSLPMDQKAFCYKCHFIQKVAHIKMNSQQVISAVNPLSDDISISFPCNVCSRVETMKLTNSHRIYSIQHFQFCKICYYRRML
jgi:hypothetical protein